VFECLPWRGQVEENGVGIGTGGLVEAETVGVDVAVRKCDEGFETVVFDLDLELSRAGLMVFEAVDRAVSFATLPFLGHANGFLGSVVCAVRRGCLSWIAIVDGPD
jgi:hypothetical protein